MPLALYDYYVLKIDVQFGWVEALIGLFFLSSSSMLLLLGLLLLLLRSPEEKNPNAFE